MTEAHGLERAINRLMYHLELELTEMPKEVSDMSAEQTVYLLDLLIQVDRLNMLLRSILSHALLLLGESERFSVIKGSRENQA